MFNRRIEPTYILEKNVPVPPRLMERFPLDIMLVGESFVIPVEELVSCTGAITYVSINEHKKFMRRRQDDGSYRIWRTE